VKDAPHEGPAGRVLRRFYQAVEDARIERKLASILSEVGANLPAAPTRTRAPGDPHKLRGIPVVGVRGGFGGDVAGSRPGRSRELDQWPRPD